MDASYGSCHRCSMQGTSWTAGTQSLVPEEPLPQLTLSAEGWGFWEKLSNSLMNSTSYSWGGLRLSCLGTCDYRGKWLVSIKMKNIVLLCPLTKFSPRTNLYISPETVQFLLEPLAKDYAEVLILYLCLILYMEADLPKSSEGLTGPGFGIFCLMERTFLLQTLASLVDERCPGTLNLSSCSCFVISLLS